MKLEFWQLLLSQFLGTGIWAIVIVLIMFSFRKAFIDQFPRLRELYYRDRRRELRAVLNRDLSLRQDETEESSNIETIFSLGRNLLRIEVMTVLEGTWDEIRPILQNLIQGAKVLKLESAVRTLTTFEKDLSTPDGFTKQRLKQLLEATEKIEQSVINRIKRREKFT